MKSAAGLQIHCRIHLSEDDRNYVDLGNSEHNETHVTSPPLPAALTIVYRLQDPFPPSPPPISRVSSCQRGTPWKRFYATQPEIEIINLNGNLSMPLNDSPCAPLAGNPQTCSRAHQAPFITN